jgi:hypothetical protein
VVRLSVVAADKSKSGFLSNNDCRRMRGHRVRDNASGSAIKVIDISLYSGWDELTSTHRALYGVKPDAV